MRHCFFLILYFVFFKNRKYILDGGSGQTLLEMGLQPEGTLWSATALIDQNLHPLILKMHEDFIDAGSDLIVTCNFSARKRRLEQYNKLQFFEEANYFAGLLAKKAKDKANKEVLIAGSLPTQGITYKADIVTNDKDTYLGFYDTAKILNPNVDIFYLDVLTRLDEIKIACEAVKIFEKPILIGAHLNNLGFLRSGESIEDVIKLSKKINCCGIVSACVSPEIVEIVLPKLSQQNLPYGFKVNAFEEIEETYPEDLNDYTDPINTFGTRVDEFTPEVFKKFAIKCSNEGANLLGGCCEVKPRHIKTLKNLF